MAPLRSELGGPLKERPLESAGLGLRSRCLRRPEILPNHDARLYLNVRARAEIVWYSPPLAFRISGSHEPLESHHDSQGLMSATPSCSKSFTFRVTKVGSCSRAVAATSPSMMEHWIPFSCARAERATQRSPMALLTGRTFASSNGSSKSFSSHCSNWARRLLWGRSSMPRRISARVSTLT